MMNLTLAAAVIWPLLAALIAALPLSRRVRDLWLPASAIVTLAISCSLFFSVFNGGTIYLDVPDIFLRGIHMQADGFRALWALMSAFAFTCSCWFAPAYLAHDQHRARYDAFTLLTLAGTMGVFLSGDLFTLFIFFELMSLSSWVWVIHEDTPAARYAGDTYLAVSVIGGLVLLMGLFLLEHLTGTLRIDELYEACKPLAASPALYAAGTLMLLGFGAKAGMFPLHFWLPMAHPVAPASASSLLSGVLTKCGVFGILILAADIFRADPDWGEIVLLLGLVTMLVGAVLALFSTDLKHTLACSSVSQIGFILLGCGLIDLLGAENDLAIRGTLLHMVNHCLIKTVLFLSAGVFAMHCHTLSLNRLRGAGRKSPLLMLSFLIGSISIAGVPLTSGYVSKTLLHEALAEYVVHSGGLMQIRVYEWLFLIAGGMTAAYMAKLFYMLFIAAPDASEHHKPLHLDLRTGVILVPAVILLVLGLFPHQTMDKIAAFAMPLVHGEFSTAVAYLSPNNIFGACISLAIGALLYFVLIRHCLTENEVLQSKWPIWLDLERLILRPLLLRIFPAFFGFICRCLDQLADGILLLLRRSILRPSDSRTASSAHETLLLPIERFVEWFGRLVHKERRSEETRSYIQALSHWEHSASSTARLIGASLSFGLLMFAAGLLVTLIYLLL